MLGIAIEQRISHHDLKAFKKFCRLHSAKISFIILSNDFLIKLLVHIFDSFQLIGCKRFSLIFFDLNCESCQLLCDISFYSLSRVVEKKKEHCENSICSHKSVSKWYKHFYIAFFLMLFNTLTIMAICYFLNPFRMFK